MSMYALITCDLCNGEAHIPNNKITRDQTDDSTAIVDRGWLFATLEEARGLGWEEREFGEICEYCVTEEEQASGRDLEQGADSFIGADAFLEKLTDEVTDEEE